MMKFVHRYAWIAGIVSLVLSAPIAVIAFLQGMNPDSPIWGIAFVVGTLLNLVAFALFIIGVYLIGNRYQNNLVRIGAGLLIVMNLISIVIGIAESHMTSLAVLGGIAIASLVLLGVANLILGIGMLRLVTRLGGLATGTGVVLIIEGACLLSVLLSPIGILLSFPSAILFIILLYREAKHAA